MIKTAAIVASVLALAGTIVPAGLFFYGHIAIDAMKLWMVVATVVWFVVTPVWLKP